MKRSKLFKNINYAKQVDPPAQAYCTILGDKPQQGDCRARPTSRTPCKDPCVPTPCVPPSVPPCIPACHSLQKSSIIQIPCDPVKPSPQFVCEPCPPAAPTKIWLIKSSPFPQKVGLNKLLMFLLSFCLPIGGPFDQGCSSSGNCNSIMVCLPCQPTVTEEKEEEKEEPKPVGFIGRHKEMDFIAGKVIYKCTCGRKNGLGGEDCPRISCQNNPGCRMNPPQCWPQFKLPKKPPPPPPDQKMICVIVDLAYYDPPQPS